MAVTQLGLHGSQLAYQAFQPKATAAVVSAVGDTIVIAAEDRTIGIDADDRTIRVLAEDRTCSVSRP